MLICDQCKEKIDENLKREVALRGDAREQIYDFGLKTTFFDFCSIDCAITFLEELKHLVKPKIGWEKTNV